MKRLTGLGTIFLLMVLITVDSLRVQAQQKKEYNVAIFLYPDADILDFAGPASTFAAAPDFHVYTVSVDGREIVSQGMVNARPQYSFTDAPAPDIIVFPGGNMRANFKDQRVFDWIGLQASQGKILMSVCNGAGILGKAGLLNNLTVTTFYAFIPGLQTMVPNAKVVGNIKYADNGKIVTAGGVSAGINTALHIIARVKGNDVAKSVATIMDFWDWKPGEGLDYSKNVYIESYLTNPGEINGEIRTRDLPAIANIPFEGELKNASAELLRRGSYKKAAQLLEQTVKWYPFSLSSYAMLRQAYIEIGRPVPVDEASFIKIAASGDTDNAYRLYEETEKSFPGWPLFTEQGMNTAGYGLLQKGDFKNAIKVFSLNVEVFPESFNVWDSLGEAYMKSGNREKAIENYKKSIELNPGNANAKTYLAQLQGKQP